MTKRTFLEHLPLVVEILIRGICTIVGMVVLFVGAIMLGLLKK